MSPTGDSAKSAAPLPASATVAEIKAKIPPASRYVIAVHGIGDQLRNATAQSVVSAFGGFFNYPLGVPLGAFRKPPPQLSAYKPETPNTRGARQVPPELAATSFVEIYWADIPRGIQQEGFTIEETKAWARTVVARLRARYEGFTTPGDPLHKQADQNAAAASNAARPAGSAALSTVPPEPPHLESEEYRAVADALEEMIETFEVLGNLLWIAEKAGWLEFDLDTLLTSYIGDVQIVADFEEFRRGILQRFTNVLDAIQAMTREHGIEDPEIYIVAHSEGTVVAFMGLLLGMTDRMIPADPGAPPGAPNQREWYKWVRGFMTLGSPIDKHLVLWPDIWQPVNQPPRDIVDDFTPKLEGGSTSPDRRIWWKNYYDKGDPVGFTLDTARDWMAQHEWSTVFRFDGEKDDHGFSRYALPGKAHNDYWKDAAVFGHFIENVANLQLDGRRRYPEPPRSRPGAVFLAYTVPYLLVYLLCCIASFLVFKTTESFIHAPIPLMEGIISIVGVGSLLLGVVGFARILKLTRSWRWILVGIGWFGLFSLPFNFTPQHFQAKIAVWFSAHLHWRLAPSAIVIAAAFVTALLAGLVGRSDPRTWKQGLLASFRWLTTGARPLVILVGFQVAVMVIERIARNWPHGTVADKPSLWPVVLAFGGFIYLWWLAVLIFDLVFVWHRYIRFQGALTALRDMRLARAGISLSPK